MEYLDTERTRPSKTDSVVVVDDPTVEMKHARQLSRFKRRPVIEWQVERPRTYFPLADKPTLFHYFAGGVESEDDALAFFRSYGPLYHDAGDAKVVRESLLDWTWEAMEARHALDAYRQRDELDVDLFDDSRESRDFRGMVNRGLKENVYPIVTRSGILLAPSNLLGAMWLMFAREVARETTVATCPYCLDLFAMSADSARRGKRFCSDACRNKAFRSKGGDTE